MRTQEEISELYNKIKDIIGEPVYSGETIEFFLQGDKVGSVLLPKYSSMNVRHILADIAGVSEYDDFHLVSNGGMVRRKGSDIEFNGMAVWQEDISGDLGKIEGIKYQFYRNKEDCTCCGQRIYKPKFPSQKELIDKLYGRS